LYSDLDKTTQVAGLEYLGMFGRKQLLICGAVYGVGLSVAGFLAAGYGEGTYVLLGLASAPLVAISSLLSLIRIPAFSFGAIGAIFAAPFLWGWVWSLLQPEGPRRRQFLWVIILYYASTAVILATTYEFGFRGWEYIVRFWRIRPFLLIAGFSWYGIGQILMWLIWRLNRNRN